MKKVFYLVIVICLAFSFVGCSKHINMNNYDNIQTNDYDDVQKRADEIRQKTGIQMSKIKILDEIEASLDNGYLLITGSVENVGQVDVENFKIIIDFKDLNDKVLDSGSTYNTSILKIGNQQKFQIYHKWDDRYKSYTARIEY